MADIINVDIPIERRDVLSRRTILWGLWSFDWF